MFSKMMLAGDLGSLNTYTETIPITGTGPVNLRTLADSHTPAYNGVDKTDITWTLDGAVFITGAFNGDGIDTGVWPAAVTHSHELQITGTIRGGGGDGGDGGDGNGALDGGAGGNGGDAINCQEDIEIIVNSGGVVEAAGGGGGGGGGGEHDTGPPPISYGGGGGGGGYPNGRGGDAGAGDEPGTAGDPGTTGGGGLGGAGSDFGGVGGNGGNINADGSVGLPGEGKDGEGAGGAAGVKGFAIRKNGHSVPVTNNGTITGTQG